MLLFKFYIATKLNYFNCMISKNITIQERTKGFTVRVIHAYREINHKNNFNDASVVLSKQFLRSASSIGANISEAIYA